MAVKLRLTRVGSKKNPIYRVVAADSRAPRDGKFLEIVGRYNPQTEPSTIELDEARVKDWLSKGAQPTEAVAALLKVINDGTLKTKEQGPSKKERYEAALAAAGKGSDDAPAPRKKAAKKAEAAAAEGAAEAKVTAEAEAERTETSETSETSEKSES